MLHLIPPNMRALFLAFLVGLLLSSFTTVSMTPDQEILIELKIPLPQEAIAI